MSNTSTRPIDRTLSGTITPGQSGLGINGNAGVLRISQRSSITGASQSDCFVSYPGHLFAGWGSYLSAEIKSVYSTAPAVTNVITSIDIVCLVTLVALSTGFRIHIVSLLKKYDFHLSCKKVKACIWWWGSISE